MLSIVKSLPNWIDSFILGRFKQQPQSFSLLELWLLQLNNPSSPQSLPPCWRAGADYGTVAAQVQDR